MSRPADDRACSLVPPTYYMTDSEIADAADPGERLKSEKVKVPEKFFRDHHSMMSDDANEDIGNGHDLSHKSVILAKLTMVCFCNPILNNTTPLIYYCNHCVLRQNCPALVRDRAREAIAFSDNY